MNNLQSVDVELVVDGEDMSFTVWAELSSGGSSSWGSDEPPWFDVEIEDIRGEDNKTVSDYLWGKIVDNYDEYIVGLFEEEYL